MPGTETGGLYETKIDILLPSWSFHPSGSRLTINYIHFILSLPPHMHACTVLEVNKTGRDSVTPGHSRESLMEKMTFEPRLETGGCVGQTAI